MRILYSVEPIPLYRYWYRYIGRSADIFLPIPIPIPIFSWIAWIWGLLAKFGNFQQLNLKNDMFSRDIFMNCIDTRFSSKNREFSVVKPQKWHAFDMIFKYRYLPKIPIYIGRYRYWQKWLISADTDIGSTLEFSQILDNWAKSGT